MSKVDFSLINAHIWHSEVIHPGSLTRNTADAGSQMTEA